MQFWEKHWQLLFCACQCAGKYHTNDTFFLPGFSSQSPPSGKYYHHLARLGTYYSLLELGPRCELAGPAGGYFVFVLESGGSYDVTVWTY